MNYELTRQAIRQIEAIIQYTDIHFGFAQTDEYVNGLYFSFDLLVDNPRLGRAYDARRRRYLYRSHQVYYRLERNTIVIVDIRNSRQNPPPRN